MASAPGNATISDSGAAGARGGDHFGGGGLCTRRRWQRRRSKDMGTVRSLQGRWLLLRELQLVGWQQDGTVHIY